MLFSLYTRDYYEHRKRRDTANDFLDKSAWKIPESVRQKVNEWAATYEVDDEFIRMFKSKSDKQHYSAAFELLTYTLLKRSGFLLTRHPETTTSKKPDFEVRLKDINSYIECTLAGNSFESSLEKIEEILLKKY